MQVFNEPEQNVLGRRNSDDFIPVSVFNNSRRTRGHKVQEFSDSLRYNNVVHLVCK